VRQRVCTIARRQAVARNSYVNFTDEIENALSVQRHISAVPCPVTVAYGTFDSPNSSAWARNLPTALEREGKLAKLIVPVATIISSFSRRSGNPYGLIGRAAMEMMKLEPGVTRLPLSRAGRANNPAAARPYAGMACHGFRRKGAAIRE